MDYAGSQAGTTTCGALALLRGPVGMGISAPTTGLCRLDADRPRHSRQLSTPLTPRHHRGPEVVAHLCRAPLSRFGDRTRRSLVLVPVSGPSPPRTNFTDATGALVLLTTQAEGTPTSCHALPLPGVRCSVTPLSRCTHRCTHRDREKTATRSPPSTPWGTGVRRRNRSDVHTLGGGLREVVFEALLQGGNDPVWI
jgi:hypothetical protein